MQRKSKIFVDLKTLFSNDKKASLNMAIEVIVIVVIAMTLLGLGLGFIKGQFGQITSIGTEVTEQVREQITSQLRTSGEKMSFPRSVQMSRGDQKVLAVGVQNTGVGPINFGFRVIIDGSQSDEQHQPSDEEAWKGSGYDFKYATNPCEFTLGASEAGAYGINVEAPKSAGTDTIKIEIVEGVTVDGACDPNAEPTVYSRAISFFTIG